MILNDILKMDEHFGFKEYENIEYRKFSRDRYGLNPLKGFPLLLHELVSNCSYR